MPTFRGRSSSVLFIFLAYFCQSKLNQFNFQREAILFRSASSSFYSPWS